MSSLNNSPGSFIPKKPLGLLLVRFDPNSRDNLGLTPLHFAALIGQEQIYKFILDLPNVHDKNPACLKFGSTARVIPKFARFFFLI